MPPAIQGYSTFDVDLGGKVPGPARLIMDNATGALYYTNSHYLTCYQVKLISSLEPHADSLSEIVITGGTIDLIVHLPGDINIGDLIPWQVLARLAALKVSFGVEVFPTFN